MRIYPVVNVSRIVQYKEQVEEQKKKEAKPIEVEGVEEWEVEKILNKRKIRGVEKYLVQWKGFTAEHDIWEREKDLENTREAVRKFEGRMSEIRRQEKLDRMEEKNFRKGGRLEVVSTNHEVLVYKVDNLVQSFLSSSLV